jgi:hypothetical protein
MKNFIQKFVGQLSHHRNNHWKFETNSKTEKHIFIFLVLGKPKKERDPNVSLLLHL